MHSERTVVVHTTVCPDEEEEEEFISSVKPVPATDSAQIPNSENNGNNSDSDNDDMHILYVARKVAPIHVTSASAASLKRPRLSDDDNNNNNNNNKRRVGMSGTEEDSAVDTEIIPDDTDYPQDSVEYRRWKERDARRPKKLILE